MASLNTQCVLRISLLITCVCVISISYTLGQSGKVGIGTASPLSLLHLRSAVAGDTTGIRLTITGLQSSFIYNTGTNMIIRNAANANQLVLANTGNIGIGTDVPVAALHIMNNAQAIRLDGISPLLTFYEGATYKGFLQYSSSNLFLQNNLAGKLFFGTNGSAQMVIDSSGKVGIGLASPEKRLHVKQNGEAVRIDGNNSLLAFYQGATPKGIVGHTGNAMYIQNQADDKLNLGTNNSIDLTIASNGAVGIGIVDPIDDLHVKGSNGWMRVDGTSPAFSFYNGNNFLGFLQISDNNLRIQNIKNGKTFLGNNYLIQTVIDADGNFGIGTQFPLAKLHLNSAFDGAISGIRLSALNSTQHSVIYNMAGNMHMGIDGVNKQLVLTPDGGVGIGTVNPNALFQVDSDTSPYAGILQSESTTGTWLGLGNHSTGGKFFQLISSGSGNSEGAGKLLLYSGLSWSQTSNLAMAVNDDGRIAIGGIEFSAGYDLSVNGKIIAEGLRVQAIGNWPDYVFEPDYNIPALHEVASFINTHGHLPGFDPAAVVESEGLDIKEITVQQQEWIEVSTLYILDQEKRIEQLEKHVEQQSRQISLLLNFLENK